MKKFFVAALAALTMAAAAAPAASAQDYRDNSYRDGGYRDSDFRGGRDYRGDFRRDPSIFVRMNGRMIRFDRSDRMFYRLMDRPFGFRPGLTYVYTDRSNRMAGQVLVFSERSRRPIDTTFAPPVFRQDRDGRWDDGRRYDDRGSDDRGGDRNFRNDRLEGGQR